MCGYDPLKGSRAVPSPSAYTRFITSLRKNLCEIDQIFDSLIAELSNLLPDLGEEICFDSKALTSFGSGKGKPNNQWVERQKKKMDDKKMMPTGV